MAFNCIDHSGFEKKQTVPEVSFGVIKFGIKIVDAMKLLFDEGNPLRVLSVFFLVCFFSRWITASSSMSFAELVDMRPSLSLEAVAVDAAVDSSSKDSSVASKL